MSPNNAPQQSTTATTATTGAAKSPYAPSSRNAFLRRQRPNASSSSSSSALLRSSTNNNNNTSSSSSSSVGTTTTPATRATAGMAAVFFLVWQFWKDHRRHHRRHRLEHYLRETYMVLPSSWRAGANSNDGDDNNKTPGAATTIVQSLWKWIQSTATIVTQLRATTLMVELPSLLSSSSSTTTSSSSSSIKQPTTTSTRRQTIITITTDDNDNNNKNNSTANSRISISNTTAITIQDNLHTIHAVLHYWFGQYTPDVAQKQLWMIADHDNKRSQVDADIAAQFGPLLIELAAGAAATAGATGNAVNVDTNNSSNSHNNNHNNHNNNHCRWSEWVLDQDNLYGARGKIAAIIVLDQFSRHIWRHNNSHSSSNSNSNNHDSSNHDKQLQQQSVLDQLALQTSQLLMERHAAELHSSGCMIPLPMYIFALLPYRHADTVESVQYVQDCIQHYLSDTYARQHEAMLGRFRKATNRRMAVLQDQARRRRTTTTGKTAAAAAAAAANRGTENQEENGDNDNEAIISSTSTPSRQQQGPPPPQYQHQQQHPFTDEDILETFPFQADMAPAVHHPIHKTIVQFLADRGIHPSPTTTFSNKDEEQSRPSAAAVIVSLSGGVDSMVIASVLAHLKRSCGYDQLHIGAVHIDYANRPESGAEADFVRRYCSSSHFLDIPQFHCRRIGEVTRGSTARDDYERIARTIRYDSYREAVATARATLQKNEKNNDNNSDTLLQVVGVMLGHHRGDLRENVLSNAHKGCGPLDLSGMTAVSTNDGIVVYRPLLPLEKTLVLDYAHTFGVPYFKDTTPHWSTRGKLRNKLLPLLEEIYGDGSMNNLSNLAVESDECRSLLQKSIIGPFMDAIVRKPMGIILNTAPWKDQPVFFWKFVLREALHSAKFGMFSDKSVTEFLKRVKAPKLKNAWLQCRRDYGVYLQEDGKVFVFHPQSFPWNKKELYTVDGQELKLDSDTMVGPWTVRAELMEDGSSFQDTTQQPIDWLKKRAVTSMEQFMDGSVEYFVEIPHDHGLETMKTPLVFGPFDKNNRPEAWKNSDLRIQSTLPLVFVDTSSNSSRGRSESSSTSLVRVSLEVISKE